MNDESEIRLGRLFGDAGRGDVISAAQIGAFFHGNARWLVEEVAGRTKEKQ